MELQTIPPTKPAQKKTLGRDLGLYFPGLAPVLSFASLSVRPLFLSLLEKYILRLDGDALRPALKAIILCLLPGLEDETSEDFERMAHALAKVRNAIRASSDGDAKEESGVSHFWQCLFLATITNPSRRQGALAFLARRLPKFANQSQPGEKTRRVLSKEAEAAISPEPGLLIRSFEAGLSDPQLLIQRGFLDLLVTHLPLDSPVLQQRIDKADLERLVAAAASVVFRRDMSLNRRLWAWFLGPEPPPAAEDAASPTQEQRNGGADTSSHHTAYFSRYGLQPLNRSVLKMIRRPSSLPVDRARPLRICLSLMDRWEVGGLLVLEVFLPALQSVFAYSQTASKAELDEVMRSASVFFDGVESGLIWGKILDLIISSLKPESLDSDEAVRRMKLARFVITRFNLKEEEMLSNHMPLVVLSTLATLNQVASSNGRPEKEVLTLAYESAEMLAQLVPERAIRADEEPKQHSPPVETATTEVLQKIQTFYTDAHGNLDFCEPPFGASELGPLLLREAGSMFNAALQSNQASEVPSKILTALIPKARQLEVLDDINLSSTFLQVLQPRKADQLLPFPHLLAMTWTLSALQTVRPAEPYIDPAELPDIMHPLVAAFWQHLSPFVPKYHVEAVRCIWQLHSICAANRAVEAAISTIIVQQGAQPGKQSDAGRRFAILWTHTMYEQSLQTERRVNRRASGVGAPQLSPVGGFQAVLTRPLLLLLDALVEEGTELCVFVRSWVQDLPTLSKVFEVLADHVQSLQCMTTTDLLAPDTVVRLPTDDTRECLYFHQHILNIIKWPSHYTWATLAENHLPGDGGEKKLLQEWIVQSALKALSVRKTAEEAHIQDLHRTAVCIIQQMYKSPFGASLRHLDLEVPLMALLKESSPSLQSLLLDAVLAALKLRLSAPPSERPSSADGQPGSIRSRLSASIDRADGEGQMAPPPPQLVECLKVGFSSPSSRLVLDDWVRFLAEVLPLFADAIFSNLLPLVECLCGQIQQAFEQLRSVFSKTVASPQIAPESTLISLINGLEQILAKAHDLLVMQEHKSAATKQPDQPQGFFGNMVSGVFSSEAQTRNPTANTRLTVLLCFQDTVRICFAIWSWGGYSKEGRQDPTSVASFGYTSVRMRNRARRVLEHLFAAEALECLETLAVLWSRSAREDLQARSILGLLNVLNGSKPKHTIPAIFNAVYSRTNPNALDPNRMSTLTSDLADTDLVSFLVDYTRSLEDDAMDEIWPDCTLFLRDVLANPLPHRQVLPSLLEFTAVIGQKVDNSNFGEQRKMRKELGVRPCCSFARWRLLTVCRISSIGSWRLCSRRARSAPRRSSSPWPRRRVVARGRNEQSMWLPSWSPLCQIFP